MTDSTEPIRPVWKTRLLALVPGVVGFAGLAVADRREYYNVVAVLLILVPVFVVGTPVHLIVLTRRIRWTDEHPPGSKLGFVIGYLMLSFVLWLAGFAVFLWG